VNDFVAGRKYTLADAGQQVVMLPGKHAYGLGAWLCAAVTKVVLCA
jgi:hypothetical protein